MGARRSGEVVEIGIRLRGTPRLELVRAAPVHPVPGPVPGGGVYELRASSFHVPLTVRDLVRAVPDGRGLRLTGLVCPGPHTLSWASLGVAIAAHDEELREGWRRRGVTWSELRGRRVAMAWSAGVAARDVRRVLGADLAAGRLADLAVHEPDDRTDEALAAATA